MKKLSKKTIIILISVSVVLITGIVLAMYYADKKDSLAGSATNETMQALIDGYDNLTDYNTQISVWFHVFKTCPYWKAYVLDQFNKYGSGVGGTLEMRYAVEADWAITKGYHPKDHLAKCNNTFGETATAYNKAKCEEENRNNQWLGLLTGALWLRKKKTC